MHSLVLVPDEARELELRVLITILDKRETLMLVHFIVMILAFITHLILAVGSTLDRDSLETLNHSVEKDCV